MQVTLGAMSAAEVMEAARRGEARASDLVALADSAENTGLGNFWVWAAQYVTAPAKGGTRVIRRESSGVKPATVAALALAAVGTYFALS